MIAAIVAYAAKRPVEAGLAAACAALLLLCGWQWTRATIATDRLASYRLEAAEQAKNRAADYARALDRERLRREAAEELAAKLGKGLSETDSRLERTRRERDDAIRSLAAGKPCLSVDLVGLLNNGVPVPDSQKATSGQQDAGSTSAAVATDTDIALWISDARARYEGCAARLNSWVDWYEQQ